jgi:hypothetical protein
MQQQRTQPSTSNDETVLHMQQSFVAAGALSVRRFKEKFSWRNFPWQNSSQDVSTFRSLKPMDHSSIPNTAKRQGTP